MNRKWYIGIGTFAVLVLGWALFRPELLLINARANEPLPGGALAASTPAPSVAPSTTPSAAVPAADPAVLARGEFHGAAHDGKGTATVHRLDDGKRILRFTGFKTSNGPALKVYLVAADDATDNATVTKAGFVDLGALKGNVGDQNYEIPADVDLGKYRAATVWCSRFGVNFATAPLKAAR